MKCELQLEALKRSVSLAERVAGKHATLPILSCLLLDVRKDKIFIRSTNLDVGLEIEVPARSDKEEVFAVPARTISSFLGQTNDKERVVVLEMSSGNLTVSISKTKSTIKTVAPEDFPAIPTVSNPTTTDFSSDLLIKGFKSVWYSASTSSVKPELASVYIHNNADELVFVATDSFRLAEKRIRLPKGVTLSEMLIPFKNAAEVVKALESMGQTVSIASNKNLISFSGNGIKITSRVIDGVFPDYRQIIPKTHTTEAVVLKQDLINALKVSAVFSDSFNQLHVVIDPKKKVFQIEMKNNDVGENVSDIDAAISGDAIEVNFNGKYISDSFQAIDSDSVSLQLNGKNKPLVIRPVSGDQSFLYLVMPMNR